MRIVWGCILFPFRLIAAVLIWIGVIVIGFFAISVNFANGGKFEFVKYIKICVEATKDAAGFPFWQFKKHRR